MVAAFERGRKKLNLPELFRVYHNHALRVTREHSTSDALEPGYRATRAKYIPERIVEWQDFPVLHDELWQVIRKMPLWQLQCHQYPDLPDLDDGQGTSKLFPFEVSALQLHLETVIQPLNKLIRQLCATDFVAAKYGQADHIQYESDGLPGGLLVWKRNEWHKPGVTVVELDRDTMTLPVLITGYSMMLKEGKIIVRSPRRFAQAAHWVVVAAVGEVYTDMMQLGLRHGYVFMADACIFLHVSPDEPAIVKSHLFVPRLDVPDVHDDHRVADTIVPQMLTFVLSSLNTFPPKQEWFRSQKHLRRFPEELRCVEISTRASRDTPEALRTYIRYRSVRERLTNRSVLPKPHQLVEDYGRIREGYCSMRCMQSLFLGEHIDPNCTNAVSHGERGQKHPLSREDLLARLKEQIDHDPDCSLEQLHIRGSSGYMLKAILRPYQYIVIVKAVEESCVRYLLHEVNVYDHLRHLQGSYVPVCLGYFRPKQSYVYHGSKTVAMMVMSYAGLRVDFDLSGIALPDRDWEQEARACVDKLRAEGAFIDHFAMRNFLYCPDVDRVLAIDLERYIVQREVEGAERKKT